MIKIIIKRIEEVEEEEEEEEESEKKKIISTAVTRGCSILCFCSRKYSMLILL